MSPFNQSVTDVDLKKDNNIYIYIYIYIYILYILYIYIYKYICTYMYILRRFERISLKKKRGQK